jgi:hypothetical protein
MSMASDLLDIAPLAANSQYSDLYASVSVYINLWYSYQNVPHQCGLDRNMASPQSDSNNRNREPCGPGSLGPRNISKLIQLELVAMKCSHLPHNGANGTCQDCVINVSQNL